MYNEHFFQNASLSSYTSYRIGGKVKRLAVCYDLDSVRRAVELADEYVVLGKGTKVLASDDGYDGTVILMRQSGIRICADSVYADAGVSLSVLSKLFAGRGFKGLEWAIGIPASVGGALVMNAGAFGGQISDIVEYVYVLRKGKIVRLNNAECGFYYRGSSVRLGGDVVLGAGFSVKKTNEDLTALTAEYTARRNAAQPKGFSCGSVFKGAERAAGWYIEQCGLKGADCGDAQISPKHANFIINRGFARARDVYTLIRAAKAEVYSKFGVKLCEEVVYIGGF